MATAEGEHGSDFEETMFCEPCNKEGITAEADGFCSNCSDYLCSTCLRYHKRLAKDHTLFDKSSMPRDFCLERCVFHPNDLVKFYCTKCDDTACSQCIPVKHQTEYCEFKHIPSYMQSQDVYSEMNEVKKSLKTVEEEASRTEEESGQKLKKANLEKSDISKSISLQKKYIKDKIEEQRVNIFKAIDDERAEFIRKLDEKQGRRKEQLFEQQELINSKIEDEERHLDDQLILYPKKMQNTALNSAKIRSKLESLTTELVNKERQGRKAELFLATRRAMHNMKTLKRDIDDVREENVSRCFSFRPSNEDISIDAPENVSLGCLSEKNQQREVEVEYGYEAEQSDELTIKVGDIIKNVTMSEGGWWVGELNGKKGMFPDNFVKVIKSQEKETKKDEGKKKDVQATKTQSVKDLANKIKSQVHEGGPPMIRKKGRDKQQIPPYAWPPGPFGAMSGFYQNMPMNPQEPKVNQDDMHQQMHLYANAQGQPPMQGHQHQQGRPPGMGPQYGLPQNLQFGQGGQGQFPPGFPMFAMPPVFQSDQHRAPSGQNMQFRPGMQKSMPMLNYHHQRGVGPPPQQPSVPPPPYNGGKPKGQSQSVEVRSSTDRPNYGYEVKVSPSFFDDDDDDDGFNGDDDIDHESKVIKRKPCRKKDNNDED